jgi:hypothetical protein
VAGLVEYDVIVDFIPPLVHISYKFQGLQGSGIYIAFVPVANFEDPIVCFEGFSVTDDVVYIPAGVFIEANVKNGFTGANVHFAEVIINFEGNAFSGLETGITDSAKVTLRIGG